METGQTRPRRSISILRGSAAAMLVGLAMLVMPAGASAAASCTFAAGALDIDVTAGTNRVSIRVEPGGGNDDIEVFNGDFTGTEITPCGGNQPLVTDTNSIQIDEMAAGQGTTFAVDLINGGFAPGLTPEANSSEIELAVNADNDGNDRVQLSGSTLPAPDNLRLGDTATGRGANLNGAESAGVDSDVAMMGIDSVLVGARGGDDTVTADGTGAPEFTAALSVNTNFFGDSDDDTLTGGISSNSFFGGSGNDVMTGAGGADSFHMEEGDDTVDGAGGPDDYASYEGFTTAQGVTLDLGQTGSQDTGGAGIDQVANVENAVGSNGGDHLTGTGQRNVIYGGNLTQDTGNDTLIGLGGNDDLYARAGNDTMTGGPGDDLLEGEAGDDSVSYAQGSTGPVSLSLDPALTDVAQNTGGAGQDRLSDSSLGAPSDPDPNHEVENITGSPFGDTLTGNSVANTITGLGGSDTISSLAGADTILVRDGESDSVSCGDPTSGPPVDAVTADKQVTDSIGADCEQVDYLPDPPPQSDPPAVPESPPADPEPGDTTPGEGDPVDTDPPETAIKKGPPSSLQRTKAAFRYVSDEAGSTFSCKLDRGAFRPCASSRRYGGLKPGKHRFQVRATDAAGNTDPTPAKAGFRVVEP